MKKMKLLALMLMATSLLAFSACSEDDSTSTGGGNTSVAVTEVTANPAIINVVAGNESEAITVTVKPDDASDKTYTMVSDNESIATIDQATRKVTGVASGSTTITITSNADDTKKATVTVNVSDTEIAITGLTLSYPFDTLTVGGKLSPSIEYTPDTTTQQGVTYAVDNATATIDATSGEVTAVSAGIVKVTATSTANNAITSEFSIMITEATSCANPPSAGFEEVAGVWEIYNATGLGAFRDEVNNGDFDLGAKLVCDITLSGDWTPIATGQYNAYIGMFDGNNKTISELTINSAGSFGLFATVGSQGIIKNVVIDGANITSGGSIGGIAVNNGGTIQSSVVKNSTFINPATSNDRAGGIVATNYNTGTIIASYVDNLTITCDNFTGGIVGDNEGLVASTYAHDVTINSTGTRIGGIVGNQYSNGSDAEYTSNYYVDVTGVTHGNGYTSSNDGATPVASIALLNAEVNDMNTAIQTWVDANEEIGYRWQPGSSDTELPTLQAQP